MCKAKCRPDLRRIRLNQCYTVLEVAVLLGVSAGTVRTWIWKGLPFLDGGKPILIPGDGMKSWLKARRTARKQKCLPDELYCCRCRCPRKAKPGSVEIIPRNNKTVAITSQCGSCDAKMNKAGSLAKLAEIKAAFSSETVAQVSLPGCEDSAVIRHLEKEIVK
jgi:excisionase family DNA binding protein